MQSDPSSPNPPDPFFPSLGSPPHLDPPMLPLSFAFSLNPQSPQLFYQTSSSQNLLFPQSDQQQQSEVFAESNTGTGAMQSLPVTAQQGGDVWVAQQHPQQFDINGFPSVQQEASADFYLSMHQEASAQPAQSEFPVLPSQQKVSATSVATEMQQKKEAAERQPSSREQFQRRKMEPQSFLDAEDLMELIFPSDDDNKGDVDTCDLAALAGLEKPPELPDNGDDDDDDDDDNDYDDTDDDDDSATRSVLKRNRENQKESVNNENFFFSFLRDCPDSPPRQGKLACRRDGSNVSESYHFKKRSRSGSNFSSPPWSFQLPPVKEEDLNLLFRSRDMELPRLEVSAASSKQVLSWMTPPIQFGSADRTVLWWIRTLRGRDGRQRTDYNRMPFLKGAGEAKVCKQLLWEVCNENGDIDPSKIDHIAGFFRNEDCFAALSSLMRMPAFVGFMSSIELESLLLNSPQPSCCACAFCPEFRKYHVLTFCVKEVHENGNVLLWKEHFAAVSREHSNGVFLGNRTVRVRQFDTNTLPSSLGFYNTRDESIVKLFDSVNDLPRLFHEPLERPQLFGPGPSRGQAQLFVSPPQAYLDPTAMGDTTMMTSNDLLADDQHMV